MGEFLINTFAYWTAAEDVEGGYRILNGTFVLQTNLKGDEEPISLVRSSFDFRGSQN